MENMDRMQSAQREQLKGELDKLKLLIELDEKKFEKVHERFEQIDSNIYFHKKEQLEAYEMHKEEIF